MGIPLVKTNYFSQLVSTVTVLKGYVKYVIYKCWRIFDVILWLTSVILDHIQKQKIMEVSRKSAWNWFNLGLGSGKVALKSQVSLSRNFLTVLVFLLMSQYDVMRMFLSCSMMIFSWLLKSWSCLLKCLQAGIALEFLTSFLWLLSLMLNGVSDLPTYWMLQIWQSSR